MKPHIIDNLLQALYFLHICEESAPNDIDIATCAEIIVTKLNELNSRHEEEDAVIYNISDYRHDIEVTITEIED